MEQAKRSAIAVWADARNHHADIIKITKLLKTTMYHIVNDYKSGSIHRKGIALIVTQTELRGSSQGGKDQ